MFVCGIAEVLQFPIKCLWELQGCGRALPCPMYGWGGRWSLDGMAPRGHLVWSSASTDQRDYEQQLGALKHASATVSMPLTWVSIATDLHFLNLIAPLTKLCVGESRFGELHGLCSYLSIYLSFFLSFFLSIYLPIYPSIHPSIHPSFLPSFDLCS